MKIGINEATELKDLSEQLAKPFSNVLHGYMIEDIMYRISQSEYQKYLLLFDASPDKLRKIAFDSEGRLHYFYRKSIHKMTKDNYKAGYELCDGLVEAFLQEVFWEENKNKIQWIYTVSQEGKDYHLILSGNYCDMTVPVNLWISPLEDANSKIENFQIPQLLKPERNIKYLSYSSENFIGKHIYDIINKLELINDMESYYIVNEVLKSQPVSGRRIAEELAKYTEKTPRVLRIKRIEQLKGYRNYAYMRKRWEQYCKRNQHTNEPWEEVVDRVCLFIEPLWISLINNEVFLDDWMPELGRFLG